MNLLRFRKIVKDLHLPDGRTVKITIDDTFTTQHVEDGDRVHATGKLTGVGIGIRQPSKQRRPLLLRNMGMPKMRQAFRHEVDTGLWWPVPPAPRKLVHK